MAYMFYKEKKRKTLLSVRDKGFPFFCLVIEGFGMTTPRS